MMEGKVVAITGGASGIGLSLAKLLASQGAKVSIADVSGQEALDKAVVGIKETLAKSGDVLTTQVDVRQLSQVSGWLKATVEKFGRLDHVANVAGVWRGGKIDEQDEDVWEFVLGVNLTVGFLAFLTAGFALASERAVVADKRSHPPGSHARP